MTKTCPRCHTNNRAEARFCLECNYAFSDQEPLPRLCPAGKHPMDPAWTSCPYCSGSQPAVNPSAGVAAGSPHPGAQAQGNPPVPTPPGGRKRPPTTPENQPSPSPNPGQQKPDPAPAPSGRKKTEFGDVAPQPQPASQGQQSQPAPPRPAQPGSRRIVAMLVTYTWQSQGQIFPVCEGRNYLGRDADCEICMEADPQMSGHHSAIYYRGGNFEITDEGSMNGVLVNGTYAPVRGSLPLENNVIIKTGATTWRFIVIPATER